MSDIKLIRGSGGGGKGGGGSGRVAQEAPDSLRSKQFARVLDLVSEGEIEGLVDGLKSVYLDDTPLMNENGTLNFQDVAVVSTTGTQTQGYLPGFSASEAEVSVGVEVKNGVPVTRTVTAADADAVRVTVGIPQLTRQDTTNGDINGTSVEIAIDVQTNGGGFMPYPVRVTSFPAALSGGVAKTSNEALHASITVSWTGVLKYIYVQNYEDYSRVVDPAMQYCSYRLKYREVGAATWTTLKTGTFSGSSRSVRVDGLGVRNWDSWQYEDRPPTGTQTFEHDLIQGVEYEFMVEKTDGNQVGSLGIGGSYSKWVGTDIISGKTTSRYQRSYLVKLDGEGPWDIRVRRITADSTSSALQNKTYWDSYTEVVEQKLRYPNSALVGISIDAAQFKSIPTRGYDVKLLKVKIPSNYDPVRRTYTGEWDGTFAPATWTDNPAWCWYDLVTNKRYGLGDFINEDQVDKWTLYSIAQYCDEFVSDGFGGTEPRFTCNVYLQTREDAYKVINSLASIFRAMTYWATGAVIPVQDAPSDPIALFTAANVVDGLFNYSGTALRTRHTVALVTWNDPSDAYRQKVEYVEDHEGIIKLGVVQTEFVAVGCTSRGQAHRIGKWLLYSERMETEVVTFRTGLAGTPVYPGAVIKTQDQARSGVRFGGRVLAATVDEITIDSSVTIDVGKSYTLSLMLPDGTVEDRAIANGAGPTSVLTPVTPFTAAPQVHAMWVLAASDLVPELWRVISVAERENNEIEILALKNHPEKYALVEQDLLFDPLPTTNIKVVPPAPTSVSATDAIYASGSGIATKILLSWESVNLPQTRGYIVKYRSGESNWTELPEIREPSVDIPNVADGKEYTLRVHTVNALGKTSLDYAEVVHTVVGKAWPPGDVPRMLARQEADRVVLSWDGVADLDLADYEIRRGAVWESAVAVGRTRSTVMKLLPMAAGNYTWLAKAVDTSGNYSTNAVSCSLVVGAPGTIAPSVSISGGDYMLTWTEPSKSFAIDHYEVHYGDDPGNTALVTKTSALSFKASANWLGSRKFWVRAVDLAGNKGPLITGATLTIAVPAAPSVGSSIVMAKAQLEWTAPVASLPISEYEVRHGSSWATGATVAKISGDSLRISIGWVGSRTFWVAAIDLAGNVGAAGSTTVDVAVPAAPVVGGEFNLDQTVISWTPSLSSLPIDEYEVGHGGVVLGRVKGTTYTFKADWEGNRDFWVRAYDLNGNVGPQGFVSLNVAAPSKPAITNQTVDNNVLLYWSGSTGSLPVATYELRRGATWETADLIGQKSGGFTTVFETAAGTYRYWVAGIDTAGNYGTPDSVSASVNQPPDYVLQANYVSEFVGGKINTISRGYSGTAVVLDGNVVTAPFPEDTWAQKTARASEGFSQGKWYWEVLITDGGLFGGAITIGVGRANATLDDFLGADANGWAYYGLDGSLLNDYLSSPLGAEYTTGDVIGVALDATAGTVEFFKNGNPQGAAIDIGVGPWYPMFSLYKGDERITPNFGDKDFAYTPPSGYNGCSNAIKKDDVLLIPVNQSETWESHFTSRGWDQPSDQIATYPYFLQPSATTGYYEEVQDYGQVLAATKITVVEVGDTVTGSITKSCTISISEDGNAWTEYVDTWQIYATNFRFVKVRVTVSGDISSGYKMTELTIRLDVKLKNDAGSGVADAADVGGTQVNFGVPFLDVTSITVTPAGTSPLTAVYDFTDTPNPTGFKVLLFDQAGVRKNGSFSWSAKGY